MNIPQSIIVATAILGLVLVGPAWGIDPNTGSYRFYTQKTCPQLLSDYARAELHKDEKFIVYRQSFGKTLGWIAGYMTGINYALRGRTGYFNTELLDEIAWVASWCRDNPSKDLTNAMEALTKARLKNSGP